MGISSNLTFTLVASNQQWWACLHHGNWQALKSRSFPPRELVVRHLLEHPRRKLQVKEAVVPQGTEMGGVERGHGRLACSRATPLLRSCCTALGCQQNTPTSFQGIPLLGRKQLSWFLHPSLNQQTRHEINENTAPFLGVILICSWLSIIIKPSSLARFYFNLCRIHHVSGSCSCYFFLTAKKNHAWASAGSHRPSDFPAFDGAAGQTFM